MDYVFIDIETTGLEPENSHIIELSATKVRNGVAISNFSTFVLCPVRLPKAITGLTGIYDEHLANAPDIKEALKAFFEFGWGCVMVDYNLPFADKFLAYYAEKCGLNYDGVYIQKIDVLPLAKKKFADKLKRKNKHPYLKHIADFCKIPNSRNDCLSQAILLSKVYGKLIANS